MNESRPFRIQLCAACGCFSCSTTRARASSSSLTTRARAGSACSSSRGLGIIVPLGYSTTAILDPSPQWMPTLTGGPVLLTSTATSGCRQPRATARLAFLNTNNAAAVAQRESSELSSPDAHFHPHPRRSVSCGYSAIRKSVDHLAHVVGERVRDEADSRGKCGRNGLRPLPSEIAPHCSSLHSALCGQPSAAESGFELRPQAFRSKHVPGSQIKLSDPELTKFPRILRSVIAARGDEVSRT